MTKEDICKRMRDIEDAIGEYGETAFYSGWEKQSYSSIRETSEKKRVVDAVKSLILDLLVERIEK